MVQLCCIRFLWYEFSKCFFFVFICVLLCLQFTHNHFLMNAFKQKGRIQLAALPWRSFHVLCNFFYLIRIHHTCPCQLLSSLSTPFNFNLELLSFTPISPYGIIHAFDQISAHAVLDPIQSRKPHHLLKTSFISNYQPKISSYSRVISHPIAHFIEIDRREPSPVLVGLATRLSLV